MRKTRMQFLSIRALLALVTVVARARTLSALCGFGTETYQTFAHAPEPLGTWAVTTEFWTKRDGGRVMDWVIFGVILFVAAAAYMIVDLVNAEKFRKATDASRRAAQEAEQQEYYLQMIRLSENELRVLESMRKHLDSAEKYLDQAVDDFADGAFAPFWDSIERAANTLGRFVECVQNSKDSSSQYAVLVAKYEGRPPKFPLVRQSVARLSKGSATAERMKAVVRTAQCNWQFASMYQQRKTNQILIAGFTDLAQALDQMTWQITTSIDDLTNSVELISRR